MNHEEWLEGFEAFKEKYPDCPSPQFIECMNLIMKKEFAQQIVDGTKTVEFRAYSKHYCDRLYDKEVCEYLDAHNDDEELQSMIGRYISPLRVVKKIHFHNYNNTWFLDCEVSLNDVVGVVDDDVAFLQEEFNCHELDEELETMKKAGEKRRPLYFYFVIKRIIDTNLK